MDSCCTHRCGFRFIDLAVFFALKNVDSSTSIKVWNVGKFWHFLGIVWLIMFVTIFVL